MKILKFGATSVATAQALERCATIIDQELPEPQGGLVVVSAMAGSKSTLGQAIAASVRGDSALTEQLRFTLERSHWLVAGELGLAEVMESQWHPLFQTLDDLLKGMGLVGEAAPRSRDAALAVVTTLAAQLLAALVARRGRAGRFRDVREVLRTDARHGRARPDRHALGEACTGWREELGRGALWVTQGFLGIAPNGAVTTLGRGGADTSATLLGEALGASEVQLWTDTDGILSADPTLVPEARAIPVMSLREAAALCAFGTKELHAAALSPVARCGLRLLVANIWRPQGARTEIRVDAPGRDPGEITSVVYKEGVSCLRLPPAQEPDLFDRLFQAASRLREAGASLYGLLATPDGGLLVVRGETPEAQAVLDDLAGSGLALDSGWAVVALVGEGLRELPGQTLNLLAPLEGEAIAAILAGDTGVSLAFLIPESRLAELVPKLHHHCVEKAAIHEH